MFRTTRARLGATVLGMLVVIGASISLGQQIPVRFDHLTIDDGLPSNSVYCALKDDDGFMWFGTDRGLSRYDGQRFVNIPYLGPEPPEGIDVLRTELTGPQGQSWRVVNMNLPAGVDQVTDLAQGHDGDVWAIVRGGAVKRFNPHTGETRVYQHDPDDPSSIRKLPMSLHVDEEGRVWIGYAGWAVGLHESDTDSFKSYTVAEYSPANLDIVDIVQSRDGRLWMACGSEGLMSFDRETGGYRMFAIPADQVPLEEARSVTCMLEDTAGRLWVGTAGGGLAQFDRESESFNLHRHGDDPKGSISSDRIYCIAEKVPGVLWIGTVNGLNEYDVGQDSWRHFYSDAPMIDLLPYPKPRHIYHDGEQIWLTNVNRGISRFSLARNQFRVYVPSAVDGEGLNVASVNSVLPDSQGNIWIGTLTGGLNRYNPETKRFTYYQHDPEDSTSLGQGRIYETIETSKGDIYVATHGGGVSVYDQERDAFQRWEPEGESKYRVTYFIEDTTGILWMKAWNRPGLIRQVVDEVQLVMHDPDDSASIGEGWVSAIHAGRDGRVWVGLQDGGLDRYDAGTQKFTHYVHDAADPTSIRSGVVGPMWEGNDGALWISIGGGGLKFRHRNRQVRALWTRGWNSRADLGNPRGYARPLVDGDAAWGILRDTVRFDFRCQQKQA